ncbi:MAG: hypothetical protein GF308_08285 [Candidatus Heimdallarchaeota archaeon]|nr:hypothetical protein [Candidatus Heimdallarchaeota archaeon]
MNTIDDYSFGSMTINSKNYSSDLILYPNKIITNWWREEGHSLCMEDLQEVEKDKPEILIIGTGAYGRMTVPKEVIDQLEEEGIKVIARKTTEAVKEYNKLVKEGKKVVAAVHLTC